MSSSRRAHALHILRRAPVSGLLALLVVAVAASAALAVDVKDVARAARAAGAPGPILYVGDSLGVGTFPRLRSILPGVSVSGFTRVGRTSSEGLSVLGSTLRRDQRVVIFDLGTNDWSAATLRSNLHRAHAQIGQRLMVVFTMNKPGVRPLNRVVETFAASASNVLLIDWHSAAAHEHLLGGDGIHADVAGYSRRADIIAHELSRYR